VSPQIELHDMTARFLREPGGHGWIGDGLESVERFGTGD
jgi:hypothetical protein